MNKKLINSNAPINKVIKTNLIKYTDLIDIYKTLHQQFDKWYYFEANMKYFFKLII